MSDDIKRHDVPPREESFPPVSRPKLGIKTGSAQPEPKDHPIPEVRDALDAGSHDGLKNDPSDEDAKLDIALDESFPTSDAPANTVPGSGEPAPSSCYDEDAERKLAKDKEHLAAPGDPGDAPK